MGKKGKRVEQYINNSAEFAQPVLRHISELVHKTCPNIEETIKWKFPHFMYNGNILCSMAALKKHCAFIFWLAPKMKDPKKILASGANKTSMGHLGRLTSVKDMPSDKIMIAYLKEALSLIEKGETKTRKNNSSGNEEQDIPDYLQRALSKNKDAFNTFQNLSKSHKNEYIEWISSAKKEETRTNRIEKAIAMINKTKSKKTK